MRHRTTPLGTVVLAAALLVACTGGGSSDDAAPATTTTSTQPTTTTTAPPCRDDLLADSGLVPLVGDDPVAVAAEVGATTHRCAELAVVAPADDGWAALVAAPLAVADEVPLLLHDPASPDATRARLDELEVAEVLAVGIDLDDTGLDVTSIQAPEPPPEPPAPSVEATTSTAPPPRAVGTPDDVALPVELPPTVELALRVIEHAEPARVLAVPQGDVAVRASLPARLAGVGLLPLPDAPGLATEIGERLGDTPVEVVASDAAAADALIGRLRGAGVAAEPATEPVADDASGTAWLVDPSDATALASASVAAATRGESVLAIDAGDLRAGRHRTAALRAAAPERVVLVGDVTEHADWQLDAVLDGPEVPGGGFRLFEGTRMVALYGHPGSTSLGALGEQDLEGTVQRTRAAAAPYGADGRAVIPTFEIIATVASSAAGPYGDYSLRESVENLRPWVDRAAAEGFYVVLDLQPGHTDFLTQAQFYEELLREPHVGLALDPEWRLEPGERHLDQIGSVSATEVQGVLDWLAQLTRDNGLPQKLVVLHQFRHSMLPDRDTIVAPPELAVVVHMDGQGPLSTKYGTYDAITTGVEDRWLWGWKNFYDEDSPTASAGEVLALDPRPVFVSYQ